MLGDRTPVCEWVIAPTLTCHCGTRQQIGELEFVSNQKLIYSLLVWVLILCFKQLKDGLAVGQHS